MATSQDRICLKPKQTVYDVTLTHFFTITNAAFMGHIYDTQISNNITNDDKYVERHLERGNDDSSRSHPGLCCQCIRLSGQWSSPASLHTNHHPASTSHCAVSIRYITYQFWSGQTYCVSYYYASF